MGTQTFSYQPGVLLGGGQLPSRITDITVIRSGFRDATDRRTFEARMIFKHRSLHPGGLKLWTLVSYKVSVRCKRCDLCFYLNVTLHAHFSVAFKPLMKREYPRNV